MLLTLSEEYGWHARQINFVLAFPHAEVRTNVYMQTPEKFQVTDGKLVLDETTPHPSKQDNVVKLIKNVYGVKDESKTWGDHICVLCVLNDANLRDYLTKVFVEICSQFQSKLQVALVFVPTALGMAGQGWVHRPHPCKDP